MLLASGRPLRTYHIHFKSSSLETKYLYYNNEKSNIPNSSVYIISGSFQVPTIRSLWSMPINTIRKFPRVEILIPQSILHLHADLPNCEQKFCSCP